MTFLVVGSGNISRRHYENLRRARPDTRVVVLSRPKSELPDWLPVSDRIIELDPSGLGNFAGAIVANPAPMHHISAVPLIEAGVPVFVEKPLADVAANADLIVDAAVRLGTPLMVGYTLRWYEPLQQLMSLARDGTIGALVHVSASVGSHLESWRPDVDYRASVSAQRALGGGALLELSHEIDYCLWLLGRPHTVAATVRQSGILDVDVEDVADLQLGFVDGVGASLHLDLIDREPHRRVRVIGTKGTVELDLLTHELSVASGSDRSRLTFPTLAHNDMYLRQQKRFLAMVDGDAAPAESDVMAATHTALAVLDVVAAARVAAETGVRTNL